MSTILRKTFYNTKPKKVKLTNGIVDLSRLKHGLLWYTSEEDVSKHSQAGFQSTSLYNDILRGPVYISYNYQTGTIFIYGREYDFTPQRIRRTVRAMREDMDLPALSIFQYIEPVKYLILSMVKDARGKMDKARDDMRILKRDYSRRWDDKEDAYKNLKQAETLTSTFEKTLEATSNIHHEDGKLFCKLFDIVCEDVNAIEPEISLGDMVFDIDLEGKCIRLIKGGQPRPSPWSPNSYHPHQTSSEGELCFGSMQMEVSQAFETLEIDVIGVLIRKFATSYNSNDSAGRYHVLWLKDHKIKQNCQCTRLDRTFTSEEAVRSRVTSDWIPNHLAVWCGVSSSYLWADECVYVGGIVYPINHREIVEVRNVYYLKTSAALKLIDNVYYLLGDCYFSELMGEWLPPAAKMVDYDDGRVTADYYEEHGLATVTPKDYTPSQEIITRISLHEYQTPEIVPETVSVDSIEAVAEAVSTPVEPIPNDEDISDSLVYLTQNMLEMHPPVSLSEFLSETVTTSNVDTDYIGVDTED
jgi:hypothetical protein